MRMKPSKRLFYGWPAAWGEGFLTEKSPGSEVATSLQSLVFAVLFRIDFVGGIGVMGELARFYEGAFRSFCVSQKRTADYTRSYG